MTILQSQIDDAPRQLCIDLPPEWEHRRLQVIVRPLVEGSPKTRAVEPPNESANFWQSVLNMRAARDFEPIDWAPGEIDSWRDRSTQEPFSWLD
ncbi:MULTISPECIES: hypothetical protein [Thiorhodovibrio]|uniref:hypothetical protein n=1 Tax=Thiorhodovibrio TaxID=61593 RepID=UPI0019119FDA|nr:MULTISPECIES: hypothetical protein [Thiorhodovibrio]MBK5969940.1 hypothetical protein [Thiorhodovibrio winogradskyi]WPL12861.1 hypothetical protein Thiosp_02640 [Thiorhodovibrio litoralis]